MSARYAIFFAPDPESALWRFGSACLGYDAATGLAVEHPKVRALDFEALSREPRRYGFHATLKPPFTLAAGVTETDIFAAAERFAAGMPAFILPKLEVAALGRFAALIPAEPPPALQALADASVREFEPFRAPLDEADRARRLEQSLTNRQQDYLDRYGYPFVFEEFRFHMTLTGPIEKSRIATTLRALSALHALVDQPVAVDAIAIFRQETRQGRFTILQRVPLAKIGP